MISRLIRESFHAPLLTALLVAAGTTIGAFWIQDLRRDVFPDLSAPVFNVITQNPAMGAEELETAIAIPLEVALAGLPDVRRVRSNSQLGVAQVTIEFEPNADYYRSRQFVAERVATGLWSASRRHRSAADLQPHRPSERDLRVHARGRPGRGGSHDAAGSRRVRGEQPAPGRSRRGRGGTAWRLSAAVPGAARSRAHVRAARQPGRCDARGRGIERERVGRHRRSGLDRVDRTRARSCADR